VLINGAIQIVRLMLIFFCFGIVKFDKNSQKRKKIMALTVFRYYWQKMDNIQREDLLRKMGVSESALYRRLRNSDLLSLKEAEAFKNHVFECFEKTITIESLTNEIIPEV
jgi:hypothetical protein